MYYLDGAKAAGGAIVKVVSDSTNTALRLRKINDKEVNIKKTIVLTGAMVPYQFGSSDGLFNLGSALAFVQTLPSGVL